MSQSTPCKFLDPSAHEVCHLQSIQARTQVAPLVEAVKRQDAEISALKEQLTRLSQP